MAWGGVTSPLAKLANRAPKPVVPRPTVNRPAPAAPAKPPPPPVPARAPVAQVPSGRPANPSGTAELNPARISTPRVPGGVRTTKAPTSLGGGKIFSGQVGTGTRPPRPGPTTPFGPAGPSKGQFGGPWQPSKPPSTVAPGPATQNAPDPSTPDTTFPIPLVPADEQAKTTALADYGSTASGLNLGLQNAAMAYGDPTLMASLGLTAAPNPNSALAIAALKAQLAGEANTARMTNNGTAFSSINLLNNQRIADAQQRADLAGYTRYQNALSNFNDKMGLAAKTRDAAINSANLDERNTAISNLPNANTATGGFKGTTAQGRKVGKPSVVAPKTKISQPKSSSVQVPKTGKGKSAGKSTTKVKSVSPVTIKKPPKAKGL